MEVIYVHADVFITKKTRNTVCTTEQLFKSGLHTLSLQKRTTKLILTLLTAFF